MEVTVAKSAGFCFGVKRAVDTVYREIESGEKPVYTFGPIIHNEQVVEDLENRGVQVIHSEDELEGLSGGTVVIRSHGVSRDVCEKIDCRCDVPVCQEDPPDCGRGGQKRPPRRHHRKRGSSGGTGHHGMGERPGYRDAYRRRSGKFCARKWKTNIYCGTDDI